MLRARHPRPHPHHTAYALEENGAAVAVFTGGSLLIGTVGRPDLVEPRLTERLARAQHASAHRLAGELPDEAAVLPTHGFGSFCSSQQEGGSTTIGKEKASNEALTAPDADTFVAGLLAGLDDIPAYYAHMGPLNAAGPAPLDLTPPAVADPDAIAARLAAGWVVDLRNRIAFAAGHVTGSYNVEAEGQLATYLAWLVPWGKPVTLLAETPAQLADAQRELARVGIDRPAAAAVGGPADWLRPGETPASFPARPSPTWRGGTRPRRSSCSTCGAPRAGARSRRRIRPHPGPRTARPAPRGARRPGVGALRRRTARRDRRLPAGRVRA